MLEWEDRFGGFVMMRTSGLTHFGQSTIVQNISSPSSSLSNDWMISTSMLNMDGLLYKHVILHN